MGDERTFSKKERMIVLFASCIASFITPLMGTMITTALPTIGIDFNVSVHDQAWVTAIYLLSCVIFLLPWAKVSDLFGKRKVFILGLVIIAAGGILAAFSTDFAHLLAARIVMGAGGAAISCTSVSMIIEVYPKYSRGTPLGINTAVVYLGSSIGPALGGILTDTLGWHSTFYMVVPFCIVALIAIMMFKTDFISAKGGSFNYLGSVVYGISMVLTAYGLMNIPQWYSYPMMIAGIALLYLFYRMQKRTDHPLLNVRMFSNKVYTRSVISTLLNYGSSYAVSFFAALYLQDINGWSAWQAGTILLIQPAIQSVLTPFTGRLSDRINPRILPTLGMIITALGLLVIFGFPTEVNTTMLILALVLLGIGYAMFSAPNTNIVMSSVPNDMYSEASGILSTMRMGGMLLSMGIAMACISIFMGSAETMTNAPMFMDAMRTAFAICVIMCVIGTVLSWFRGSTNEFGPWRSEKDQEM